MLKVFISPHYSEHDRGDQGGISRVVSAQRQLLSQHDIEVVEDAGSADLMAIHAGAWVRPPRANMPIVAHCHGLYWDDYEWPSWAIELNNDVTKVMKLADAVTAPSKWVANAIQRGLWIDAKPIYHGVDASLFSPGESLGYVLWNKSRVDPVCDVGVLEMLASMALDVKFVSTHGHRTANLEVTGLVPYEKQIGFLQHAGIYLCNTRETFGIGTLEALACGVPVIGWRWGGQAEFIENEKHGWLATPGDYESLKQGLYWCLEHRAQLSGNCRKLAEQFSWDDPIKQYADLYHETYERVTSQKRVSVIITSYNLREYLSESIASVTQQLTPQDELIIVDDCSTDGSYELALACTDGCKEAEVIQTPHNLYLAGALNYAIEQAAQGRYILCLDADNKLGDGALSTLAGELDKDRNLDIAYGKMRLVPEGREGEAFISDWPPKEASVEEQLKHHNQIPSTCMYRRSIFDRVGGYRRRCRTAEDADFWCRALSFGLIGKRVTDAVTLVYLDRTDSMSHVNRDWPWEAWYTGFDKNYACSPAPLTGKHTNVSAYEPPVVSVIIPVGPGHEELVVDAIDSLCAQSFIKWELIVVNDSGRELRGLPPFIRYYSTPMVGSGVSVARNIGLNTARGRYILFLDADDYLDPKALEKMLNVIKQYGGYAYCDFYKLEGTNAELREVSAKACAEILTTLPHPITGLYPNLWGQGVKFDETMRVGEDWDYVINIHNQGYCGTRIPEPLIYYRVTSGTNRTELLGNIDNIRRKLDKKWGKADMCGCSKGGGQILTAQQAVNMAMLEHEAANPGNDDLVLLEFIPENTAPMTYRGRSTGRTYRFGSDEVDRVKMVHRADAELFLMREHEFRIYDPTSQLASAAQSQSS